MNLFNLFAKLTLDNKDYEKKLEQSEKSAASFSSKGSISFKNIAKGVFAFGGAIVAATAAVIKLAAEVADFGGDIDDNAQKLGMSTTAYQEWAFAMKMNGAEASTLQLAVRQLNEFTNQLADGQGDALLALQDLGIGYEDFMALPIEDQLEMIVNGLQGMENQTDKTRLAQEIFGNRAYQELMPLLNQEKGYIEDLSASMKEMGLVMSEEAVQASAKMGDSIDILKQKVTIAGANMVASFFPATEKMLNGIIGFVTGSDTAFEDFFAGLDEMLDGLIDLATGLIEALPEVLMQLIKELPTIVNKLVDALFKIDWGTLIVELLNVLLELTLVSLPKIIFNLVENMFDLILSFFSLDGLAYLGKLALMIGEGLINGIIGAFESGINFIINGINKLLGFEIFGKRIGITIPEVTLPRVSFLEEGGMFEDLLKGTAYAVAGENGAEIVAQGSQGTGVANVEQIADAQYSAMVKYGFKEAIAEAVNAIIQGMGFSKTNKDGQQTVVVKIGEREFKSYVVSAVNEVLKSRGRQSLNAVTAYR